MKVYSSKHSLTESAKDARLMNGSLNRTTSSQMNPFGNDDYSESGRSGRSGNPFSDDGNPFSDNESRGGNPFSGKVPLSGTWVIIFKGMKRQQTGTLSATKTISQKSTVAPTTPIPAALHTRSTPFQKKTRSPLTMNSAKWCRWLNRRRLDGNGTWIEMFLTLSISRRYTKAFISTRY